MVFTLETSMNHGDFGFRPRLWTAESALRPPQVTTFGILEGFCGGFYGGF